MKNKMRFWRSLLRIAVAFFVLTGGVVCHAQQVVNLDKGWQFYYDWQSGLGSGMSVDLPHTYNRVDAPMRADYFRGLTAYVRGVDVPDSWRDKAVLLRVGAANSVADVYVDGRHVGSHVGGSTGFVFNLSPFLRYGARNMLQIRVNNAANVDVMPLAGDYNQYGGLFRSVELELRPGQLWIAEMSNGASGVAITQMSVGRDEAQVNVVATVNGVSGVEGEVKFVVRDGAGVAVDSSYKSVVVPIGGVVETAASFVINEPRLWDGVRDPYLYSVDVEVTSSAVSLQAATSSVSSVARATLPVKVVDRVSGTFGLRYFEVDRSNRFLLNGRVMQVRGVVLNADWQGLGSAIYRKNQQRDLEIILGMGANAVRVVGGVVDPFFAELCDRAGVIIWCDLPFTGAPYGGRIAGYTDSPQFAENAMTMAREMVGQLYNHPSIIFWGVYSEISRRGDDPLPLVRQINQWIKEEDGQRLTAATSNQDGELNFVTDIIGFAPVFGWHVGRPSDIGNWTAQLRREWPNLKAGLSSYGAGGYAYHDADSLARPLAAGNFHPQQWQSHLHEVYWREISRAGSGLWGGFVGTMFDYASPNAFNGPFPGVNDCGMVSYDRALCKEAYYFYKAAWQRADSCFADDRDMFAYIARPVVVSSVSTGIPVSSSSPSVGASVLRDVKVYSTYDRLQLSVNGVPVTTPIEGDEFGVFVFKGVKMDPGKNNRITVSSLDDKNRVVATLDYGL